MTLEILFQFFLMVLGLVASFLWVRRASERPPYLRYFRTAREMKSTEVRTQKNAVQGPSVITQQIYSCSATSATAAPRGHEADGVVVAEEQRPPGRGLLLLALPVRRDPHDLHVKASVREVQAARQHHLYQGDPKLAADLAILEVHEPFLVTGQLHTATLAHEQPLVGTVCTAAGWGTTAEVCVCVCVCVCLSVELIDRRRCVSSYMGG
ncbi:Glandular kallikrein-10 [Portunus trituberculatus]|uniref:Glandular kallikrein-10 n=1 Tax=Portunus trituberculatus TaxID=210409 RepID=A0A5B7FX93_PORTR|nr:Glandular kallikrein-10 [Portunus trituberculatus]